MIGILIVLGMSVAGALLGFFIPFILAQFDQNPAWSFIPMLTVPIGIILGFIAGLVIALRG